MLPYHDLPVVFVSAADTATATSFIAELIDDEVEDVGGQGADRVWRLSNKYYTAEVRVHAGDGDGAAPPGPPEALVLLLGAADGEREARERWARTTCALGGAPPALALAAGSWPAVPPALRRWAAAQRVEAVPLLEEPQEGGEACGVRRVREALHAHPWRGLRRTRPPAGTPAAPARGDADSDEEAHAVERAEAFALALGALGSARASPAAAVAGAEDDASRRQRAEELVAAFASALGLRLGDC